MPADTPSITRVKKPSNAGWIAKADVNPEGQFGVAPAEGSTDHEFRDVNVAWYGDGRIKVTIKGAGPAAIRQAYLSGAGQDVILDVIALPASES
jgi:hypothetical protein